MRKVESFIEIIQVSEQGSMALSQESKGEEEGRRPKTEEEGEYSELSLLDFYRGNLVAFDSLTPYRHPRGWVYITRVRILVPVGVIFERTC